MKKLEDGEEATRNFPFEVKPLDGELDAELFKDFPGERTGFVQVGPKKWFFSGGYSKEAVNYYNFQIRPDDVFVATFPRSANDLNYETAEKIRLVERFPFLELGSVKHSDGNSEMLTKNSSDPTNQIVKTTATLDIRVLEKTSGKRFIKTHLPFSLLPPNLLKVGCKVVYVARNPKDVAVSFYHLNRLLKVHGYIGDFLKFWDYFERNLVRWAPYWEHIKEGWENRNNQNVLFLFYENINKNLRDAIAQVVTFLEKDYTNEQIEQLAGHLNIENFRHNKSVTFDYNQRSANKGEENYIRKGKNGGSKDYFDEELKARADYWIAKNLQNIPGFCFPDITE